MKFVRNILLLVVILGMIGHQYIRSKYRFTMDIELIDTIQIMHRVSEDSGDPTNYSLIKELEADEFCSFMNQIYALKTKKGGTPPRWGYGEYIAKVTYQNGDMEILGSYCIEYVRSGGQQSGVGEYYFVEQDSFLSIIQSYLSQ